MEEEVVVKVEAITDLGKKRKNNEDGFFVDNKLGLFVVADGMGGHLGGEVASDIAVKAISEYVKQNISLEDSKEKVFQLLMGAIYKANEEIRKRAAKNPSLTGMGTTVVVALLRGERLYIAHVGDSRAYIIKERNIEQVTEDHSVVVQLVKANRITPEEAKTHRLKHVLSQAVGTSINLSPDIQDKELNKGEYLLLCTDGLTDMLSDEEIFSIVSKNGNHIEKSCKELVSLANEKGGKDNITVVLLYNS